jgi:tetratricopeptide (TPR) repeat protein
MMNHTNQKKLFTLCCFLMLQLLISCEANRQGDKPLSSGSTESVVKARIAALNKRAKSLNRDSTNQAIASAYEAYLLAYENKYKELEADALVILSEGYLYNDIYDLALEYSFDALEIYKDLDKPAKMGATYTLLGWIYYDVENAEFSLKYHTMAYDYYKTHQNPDETGLSLNAIGLIYQLKNEFGKAEGFFKQALVMAEKHNKRALISAAYNNLGICSNNNKNYKQAIVYFNLALQYSTKQLLSLAELNNQMAYSLINLGRNGEALTALQKARAFIDQSSSNSKKENLLDNYKVFSLLYQRMGDYRQAFENTNRYNAVREEFLSKNKVNALLTLTLKREAQEKERQLEALSVKESLKSFQRNALAIIVVLLIVIGILLYGKLRSRQRKKAEQAALKQQEIEKELEHTVLDKKALNERLDFNHIELKNYALYIAHRNDLIVKFIEELGGLDRTEPAEIPHHLHKLVNKFKYDINLEKYVEDFNLKVETQYQDFFYNLQQKFPHLSQNERRLCAQIRLSLSIKEIATLNNISVKSAEMARYRLRKHFGLQQNDNLNDYLKSF